MLNAEKSLVHDPGNTPALFIFYKDPPALVFPAYIGP